jgi:NH3-dependent NAD+ synthetase
MPTSNELRVQAKDCLELARNATDYYAKIVLKELAQKLQHDAHQAERRKRDFATYSNMEAR